MTLNPALYLIPVNISDAPLSAVLPEENIAIVKGIKHFIVENIRTARRFLKKCDKQIDIDTLTFYELNRHTNPTTLHSMLDPLRAGLPVGVMSEAGCPAVADPGSDIVAIAQRESLKVVPLVGPSSILMALMASGFSGQGFCFNGYLPISDNDRKSAIRRLETEAYKRNITQIFIETPYRNAKMLNTLCDSLKPDTLICVARDITDPALESILTLPAKKWRNTKIDLEKHPAIFLIYHP